MKSSVTKLTLHHPATFQIKVPGALDPLWVENVHSLRVTVEESRAGQPITILTGAMDQAALHGLLRQLYGLGLPIISVICIEFAEKSSNRDG